MVCVPVHDDESRVVLRWRRARVEIGELRAGVVDRRGFEGSHGGLLQRCMAAAL